MEDELLIIKQMGATTSKEINEVLQKNLRSVVRGLKRLEKHGEIQVLIFKHKQFRRYVYVTKELYDNQFKTQIASR